LRDALAEWRAREINFRGTGFFDLSLYLLAFCDDLAQGEQRTHGECFASGSSYTAARKLLNFASGLTRRFRIGLDRYKSATSVRRFRPDLHNALQSGNAS
jgi:hypothetical protein